jgi:hypothetical protein
MHPARVIVVLVLVGGLLGAVGCSDDPFTGTLRPVVPTVPLDQLAAAPDTLAVAGCDLTLETYLWRDFMPISPPDGKPLIALIRVVEANQQEIPAGIDARYLWVVNGAQVWATTFSDEPRPETPKHVLERIARNGPKWGPKIEVDVIVGVTTASGDLYLLRAADQWIHRTD